MNARIRSMAALLAITSRCAAFASAGPESIELPPETAKLKPSDLPGYRVALQKCGICHSADYINLQPPLMTTAQWTGEVVKMHYTYGAPLTDDDIASIGQYLGAKYGGQGPTEV